MQVERKTQLEGGLSELSKRTNVLETRNFSKIKFSTVLALSRSQLLIAQLRRCIAAQASDVQQL